MDQFTYHYYTLSGDKSNRLNYVTDAVTTSVYADDIKNGQTTGNYTYNKVGELIEDVQEDMTLQWRFGDHKLSKIYRGTNPPIKYQSAPYPEGSINYDKLNPSYYRTSPVNFQNPFR